MRTLLSVAALLLAVFGFTPALLAGDGTGTIAGAVQHPSVKKYPTVVYIEEIPGQNFSPSKTNPTVDQKDKAFLPHVLVVVAGTTVNFLNSDSFKHNVYSPDGEQYNLGEWDKGGKATYTFKQPGVYTQLCKLHPEMTSYVLVLKTAFFAMANGEGKFRIPNLPPGKWKLKVWNERLRPAQLSKSFDITVAAGAQGNADITF